MKITKEREKLKPKKLSWLIAIFSGVMLWIRMPCNLFRGVSLSECIKQEKYDLWNVGLEYRVIFSPNGTHIIIV